MRGARSTLAVFRAAMLIAALVTGCTVLRPTGRLRVTRRTAELGDAESVIVNLEMSAGELKIDSGSDILMEGEFRYNVAAWEPVAEYQVTDAQGELTIRQPDMGDVRLGNYVYEWDLRFAEDVPMAMNVQLGAGRSRIDVADLDLTALAVNAGAGETTINLSRAWADDLDVSLRGVVGEAIVYLPAAVSVRVEVEGGLGDVDTMGLTQQNGAYVNAAYDGGDATLELTVEGGIGQISLEVVE